MIIFTMMMNGDGFRGECVRLKNFVVGAEISDNTISDCGIRDYIYDAGGENGEGIYVGTSSSQVCAEC